MDKTLNKKTGRDLRREGKKGVYGEVKTRLKAKIVESVQSLKTLGP